MQKMKAKGCNGSLGLLPRGTPVSLLVILSFGEEIGVKMASPLPPFKFLRQTRSPR